jgi:hypothetical protein
MSADQFHAQALRSLAITTDLAYQLSWIHPAPKYKNLSRWFETYGPGDLIMEQSTIYRPSADAHRFGYFVSSDLCWATSDEEWERECAEHERTGGKPLTDNDRGKDQYTIIKLLTTGEEFWWRDYRFIRVPNNLSWL